MNAAEVRRSFAEFCGDDRYRQFVAAIWSKAIPKQRLVFWQEQLWREFSKHWAAALPESFVEVQRVFQVCPRHLQPLESLERDRDSTLDALLAKVPEEDRTELFPFTVIALTQRGLTEVLSCAACRADLGARWAMIPPGA